MILFTLPNGEKTEIHVEGNIVSINIPIKPHFSEDNPKDWKRYDKYYQNAAAALRGAKRLTQKINSCPNLIFDTVENWHSKGRF